MLGKLSVSGRPTNLDNKRARAAALTVGAVGLFGHFFYRLSFLFTFSLSLGGGPISTGWLVVLDLTTLLDNISVYIGPSPKEREKENRNDRRE